MKFSDVLPNLQVIMKVMESTDRAQAACSARFAAVEGKQAAR